jgi:hypothetical protein
MSPTADFLGRVYRCAWCHGADPVAGGLLYFTYTHVDGEGHRQVAAADPTGWNRSDGICPAHLAALS